MFDYFGLGLFIFFCWLLGYTIIDRICKSIEHCATAKAYGKFKEQGVLCKPEDVEKTLNEEIKKMRKRNDI